MQLLTLINSRCKPSGGVSETVSTPDDDCLLAEIGEILKSTASAEDKCQRMRVALDFETRARKSLRSVLWVVWQKTEGLCAYCGVRLNPFDRQAPNGYHVDHVVPVSRGGSDDAGNLLPACRSCNQAKGGKTAAEWGYTA